MVRHGETVWNQRKRLQGQIDEPLAPEGIAQAKALAPFFANEAAPQWVGTSDLSRAANTAALLGFPDAVRDARFREINVGSWGGRSIAELGALEGEVYAKWRQGVFTPPGGESWPDFTNRIRTALMAVVATGHEKILVVAHGGVIRAAVEILLNVTPSKLAAAAPATVASFSISMEDGEWRAQLEGYNIGPTSPVFDAPD